MQRMGGEGVRDAAEAPCALADSPLAGSYRGQLHIQEDRMYSLYVYFCPRARNGLCAGGSAAVAAKAGNEGDGCSGEEAAFAEVEVSG